MTTQADIIKLYSGRRASLPQTLVMDHVSGATRLLEKRRQMFEVQEALDAQKEEFARREDAFRRREEALRRKDLELQESLIKFNKFLQENESKRSRAIKRAQDEKKQRESKEAHIACLKVEAAQKSEEERQKKKDADKNMKYQQYLASVVDYASKDYAEIEDIINRSKVLHKYNQHLVAVQGLAEKEHDHLAVSYTSYAKDRSNEILNYSNELASLQKELELTNMRILSQQNEVDSSIRETSDKTLELWQILGSVENLLERCEQGLKSQIIKKGNSGNNNSGSAITTNNNNLTSTHLPLNASGNNNTTNPHNHNSSGGSNPSCPPPSSRGDLEVEGGKAKDRLDAIAMYMSDFRDIAADFALLLKKQPLPSMTTTTGQQQPQAAAGGGGGEEAAAALNATLAPAPPGGGGGAAP